VLGYIWVRIKARVSERVMVQTRVRIMARAGDKIMVMAMVLGQK
jgi:hypothetical protein